MTQKFSITIGTHKSTKALRRELLAKGHKISGWAEELIKHVKVAKKPQQLELEAWSVEELGLQGGATNKEIYAAAHKQGLEICPAETALQLRLHYTDQPADEWLIIAMEPIVDADGYLSVLSVYRSQGGSWVDGYYAYPGRVWYGVYRLVFCRKYAALASESLPSLPLAPLSLAGEIITIKGKRYRLEEEK